MIIILLDSLKYYISIFKIFLKPKGKAVFLEINNFIKEFTDINIILSTDLKSFWEMTDGRFKFATDKFCPYCSCQKDQIEAIARGTHKAAQRTGILIAYFNE